MLIEKYRDSTVNFNSTGERLIKDESGENRFSRRSEMLLNLVFRGSLAANLDILESTALGGGRKTTLLSGKLFEIKANGPPLPDRQPKG